MNLNKQRNVGKNNFNYIDGRTLENIRFGIEIEVEFPTVKDSMLLIQKHRIIKGWELDSDGSLDNGAEYRPKDRNKLHFNEDCKDQIREIIGLIKAHRGTIRPTCGLHIHIDMSKFTNKEITQIVKKFITKQDGLYRKFGVLKSRSGHSALKIPKSTKIKITANIIDKLSEEDYFETNVDYFRDRNYGLNLMSLKTHGTLEFRLFNGTIQTRNIFNYIKWTIEFCIKDLK